MKIESLDRTIERIITAILLVCVGYGVLALGGVRSKDQAVLAFMVGAASILWVVRLVAIKKERVLWPGVTNFVLLFVGYAVVRYWTSDVEYVARKELWRITLYAWFFLLVINNLYRQENISIAVLFLVVLAAMEALYGIYQFVRGADTVLWYTRPALYHGRGSGTYICPNHLAGLLEMGLGLAIGLFLIARTSDFGRMLSLYVCLVILCGIVVTLSRGGWLATLGILIPGVWFWWRRLQAGRRLTLALAAISVFVLGVVGYKALGPHKEKIIARIEGTAAPGKPGDATIRWHLTVAGTKMWLDHFWFGVGPAHFDVRFPQYRPRYVQSRPIWVHNDWINMLVDYGLVGGIIVGAGIFSLVNSTRRVWKVLAQETNNFRGHHSNRAAFVLGSALGLSALAVHSFFDFNLHIPANALVAMLLAGLLAVHYRYTTRFVWVSSKWHAEYCIGLLVLLGVSWLGWEGVISIREAYWLDRANNAQTLSEQLTAYQTAWWIEPKNPDTPAALGEVYRLESWEGGSGWQWLAEEAVVWYQRSLMLNKWDPYPWIRIGMCLDWLERHGEADGYFQRAVELDPNNHYVLLMRGWHAMQCGRWEEAASWFKRSLEAKPWENWVALRYLKIVQDRLGGG